MSEYFQIFINRDIIKKYNIPFCSLTIKNINEDMERCLDFVAENFKIDDKDRIVLAASIQYVKINEEMFQVTDYEKYYNNHYEYKPRVYNKK